MQADRTNFKVIGTSPIRHDGVDKVTGRAAYGADIKLSGMLHGAVLRSPHPHALIVSIDISKARDYPGVQAVITSADLPQPGRGSLDDGEGSTQATAFKTANMLARDKVLYEGHAIAAVAASSRHTSEEAVRLIEVDYEPLKPVMDARKAVALDAPLLHASLHTESAWEETNNLSNISKRVIIGEGDIEKGFAEADIIIENEYETATVHQGYIETQNATALWHEDGRLEVWCSTQGAFKFRRELAELLEWPVSKIRVYPMEIGGGFGGKLTSYLEVLAALLSKKSGRPVKMAMSRAEVFRATGPTPATWEKVKIGVTNAGKMTAAEAELVFESGAFPGCPLNAGCNTVFGPYSLTNVRIEGCEVVVNKPQSQAYRAPGATMSEFAAESVVDEISRGLGMDPIEFRLLNASKEGTWRADGLPFGRVGNVECLEAIKDSNHFKKPIGQPASPHLKRGRGVASGFWPNIGLTSSVQARVNADGTVTMLEGNPDIGGTRTSVAMQMAEALSIPIDEIKPVVTDTDSVSYSDVTAGSRVTFTTGYAAYEAANDIIRQMLGGLSRLWQVGRDRVTLHNGVFSYNGESATFAEAAALLHEENIGVLGKATVSPTRHGPSFTAQLVDIEVDTETGKVKILRYTAAQDVGKAVYPPYVEGQIQGGVVQGIGWALNEEYWYDESGSLQNASYLDYRIPTTLDVPFVETIIVEVPNPGHPYGVRGVGEASIIPGPAAIANALFDAVGVRMHELPMSPHKILHAISRKS